MLSDKAVQLLTHLHLQPAASLCVACAARDLAQVKWDVLKPLRELIEDGHVLCDYALCLSCRKSRLVVMARTRWAA